MATPRKNASQAEQLRVSQIGDFRARMGGIIELPTGLVVKAKNPGGLTAFIANGSIPNSLLAIVQKALNGGKADVAKEAAKIADDTESLGEMVQLFDIVCVEVIKEPKVRLAPTEADVTKHNILFPEDQVSDPYDLRKEDEFLYTDEIEMIDKQFLFQWITGGTRDLEKFRKEYESNLATLSAVQADASGAEPGDGTDAG